MPDLSPTPSQLAIPLPQPKLAHEFSEMTPEVPDLGLSWGEFWTEEVLEEETTEELVVFGAPSRGNRVVFVVDVSTSMVRVCGREGVEAVKSDLRRAIDQLEEGIQFNVICFGNVADGFSTQPVAATMGNKVLAHRFMVDYFTGKFTRSRTGTFGKKGVVNGIPYTPILPADVPFMKKTGGGSRYDLALVAAFQQKATTVYLLTDGAPSTTRKGLLGRLRSIPDSEILRTVVAAAKANYGKHLPAIHTVSVNGVGAGFLMEVSRQFGGRYRELKATSLKVSVPAQPGR